MTPRGQLLDRLELLQLELFLLEEDAGDQQSFLLQTTLATSITELDASPKQGIDERAAVIRQNIGSCSLVLECLDDMIMHESALIETALALAYETLLNSVPLNSYSVPASHFCPLR